MVHKTNINDDIIGILSHEATLEEYNALISSILELPDDFRINLPESMDWPLAAILKGFDSLAALLMVHGAPIQDLKMTCRAAISLKSGRAMKVLLNSSKVRSSIIEWTNEDFVLQTVKQSQERMAMDLIEAGIPTKNLSILFREALYQGFEHVIKYIMNGIAVSFDGKPLELDPTMDYAQEAYNRQLNYTTIRLLSLGILPNDPNTMFMSSIENYHFKIADTLLLKTTVAAQLTPNELSAIRGHIPRFLYEKSMLWRNQTKLGSKIEGANAFYDFLIRYLQFKVSNLVDLLISLRFYNGFTSYFESSLEFLESIQSKEKTLLNDLEIIIKEESVFDYQQILILFYKYFVSHQTEKQVLELSEMMKKIQLQNFFHLKKMASLTLHGLMIFLYSNVNLPHSNNPFLIVSILWHSAVHVCASLIPIFRTIVWTDTDRITIATQVRRFLYYELPTLSQNVLKSNMLTVIRSFWPIVEDEEATRHFIIKVLDTQMDPLSKQNLLGVSLVYYISEASGQCLRPMERYSLEFISFLQRNYPTEMANDYLWHDIKQELWTLCFQGEILVHLLTDLDLIKYGHPV